MSAYYNDNDPNACAHLRELIKDGLIEDGEVDERSITEVRPEDVRGFRRLHWFAGIDRGASMIDQLRAPFPWHGGKSRWAPEIWSRLGNPTRYLEPFSGSLAVLLARPPPIIGNEIVGDLDGALCNFWRAIKHDPDGVAQWADYPTIHHDMEARHRWILKWRKKKAPKLLQDPEWYSAKAAGWWVWGTSLAIGGGFNSQTPSKSIPVIPDGKGDRSVGIPSIGGGAGGRGISRQRSQIPRVHKSIPKVKSPGDGVSRNRANIPGADAVAQAMLDGSRLQPWFHALAERLANVIVLNRDWTSFQSPSLLGDLPSSGKDPSTAIFLDPPYAGFDDMYGAGSEEPARKSFEWAVANGERYRIAYACGAADFDVPDGWECSVRDFQGIRREDRREKSKDMIMYSPACLRKQGFGLGGL